MKISEKMENKYVEYLYIQMVDDRFPNDISYKKLFNYLHSIDFKHFVQNDENRAGDGLEMRYYICRHLNIEQLFYSDYYMNKPCSVLEMIYALADKCEDIMDNPEYGDRTSQWFWGMINNLGLGAMYDSKFDEKKVEKIITKFLNRKYKANGQGGLFTIKNCKEDLRKEEIWYQMCWYLNSIS